MKFYECSFSGKLYIKFHNRMIISFFIIENKLTGIKREYNNRLPEDTHEVFFALTEVIVSQVMSWLVKNKQFIDYEG